MERNAEQTAERFRATYPPVPRSDIVENDIVFLNIFDCFRTVYTVGRQGVGAVVSIHGHFEIKVGQKTISGLPFGGVIKVEFNLGTIVTIMEGLGEAPLYRGTVIDVVAFKTYTEPTVYLKYKILTDDGEEMWKRADVLIDVREEVDGGAGEAGDEAGGDDAGGGDGAAAAMPDDIPAEAYDNLEGEAAVVREEWNEARFAGH